jgi:hypothetical protein
VTLSFSSDGLKWEDTAVAMTCTDLSTTSTCKLRYPGRSKNGGPSYPREYTHYAAERQRQPDLSLLCSNVFAFGLFTQRP